MKKELPEIGASVKVHLNGESPWADCIAINKDEHTWVGQIKNKLVPEWSEQERKEAGIEATEVSRHPFKYNDLLRFVSQDFGDFAIWVPETDIEE